MRRVVLILLNRQSLLWLAWRREGKKDEKAMKQVMSIKQNLASMRHPNFLSKLMNHSDVCVAELEIRHGPSYFQLQCSCVNGSLMDIAHLILHNCIIHPHSSCWLLSQMAPVHLPLEQPSSIDCAPAVGEHSGLPSHYWLETSGNCPCGSLKLRATSYKHCPIFSASNGVLRLKTLFVSTSDRLSRPDLPP